MTTASVSDATSPDPAGVMVGLLNSFVTVQSIHAVAVLGVADLLADGPASVDVLATATSTDATSLHRVLRLLAGQGVFAEEPDGRFSSTSLGDLLQSANPLGVRDWAVYAGSAAPWAAWGQLTNSLRTGEPGFVLAHGLPTYEYLPLHPELGATFDRWMTNQSRHQNQAIVSVFDFSSYQCIVDVGGGQGSTLAAILGAYTKIRGVLFDLPTVVAGRDLATSTYGSRCEVIGGNMLDGVPPGGDIYLLKRVLMTIGDDAAERVLRHCVDALPPSGRVVVVEMIMPSGNKPSAAKTFDVLMMLANRGGRVRSEDEVRRVFARSGLEIDAIIGTSSPNSIIVGKTVE